MRLGILGFATVCALGMSSAGFAANRTYFLNVPRIDTLGTIGIEGFKTESFQAFGTITTAAPARQIQLGARVEF